MSTRLKISTVVCFISFNLYLTSGARILGVFPTPSISHQVVFRPLVQELVKRGHEVTVITTDPAFKPGQAPTNLTEIDVHDLSYKIWINALEEMKTGIEDDDVYSQIQVVIISMSKDLNDLLNKSKHGVIYFSFGTNVRPSIMPQKKVQMMIKVFSELPYDVIWKWDLDSMPGKSDNIKLYKWLPQSDLLRHPKIKLFITQGGLQSTDEAIDAGVPLIGIPLLGDQWYNTEKYQYHKIGVKLDMPSLTEEIFKNAIVTVISDRSYRENIIRLRNIFRDEPQTPLERAVWWTEYVLRHGGAKHLRAAGANISWTQYLEIQLIVIVLPVLLFVILLFVWVLKFLKHFVREIIGSMIKIKTN
ncbi:UDP-glucuronosyltransferase 2B15 isoform X2 [Bicyclus anynana]|uniref:UDP-glucuronosyltransferase n=1 Tax=Bicyclus anynana TaxID=110368 RepID=A0ABM3LYZ1_BICAN|nr:UDP-glucuronosyltransferase 2B15 isoform X2 [Bicyclus anynana]